MSTVPFPKFFHRNSAWSNSCVSLLATDTSLPRLRLRLIIFQYAFQSPQSSTASVPRILPPKFRETVSQWACPGILLVSLNFSRILRFPVDEPFPRKSARSNSRDFFRPPTLFDSIKNSLYLSIPIPISMQFCRFRSPNSPTEIQ